MWALCRRDHGITWPEFQELTLAHIEALEARRAARLRHDRFNAALVTATLFNANRAPDSPALSPFDFLPGFERDPEEEERAKRRKAIKHSIALAFLHVKTKSAEEVQEEKRRMIDRMKAAGVEDPEELIREVYPDL